MATIEGLPKELLEEIFSHYIRSGGQEEFLRNIPRVCKAWNVYSSASTLWKNVITYDWNFLLNISRKGLLEHTQSLEVNYCGDRSYSDTNLSVVLKNIRDLKALALKGEEAESDVIKLVTENCPHLERFHLWIDKPMTSQEWEKFLTVCGPTLKDLELKHYGSNEAELQHLSSGIGAKCPLLERLSFGVDDVPFPINEIRSGCPKLKELEFSLCDLITDGTKESLGCGFKDLKKFSAIYCNFSGLDVHCLLKDSMELEHLVLFYNRNLVFRNISRIPSEKVRILNVYLKDPDENLKVLSDAVYKWRRTLSVLDIKFRECDINCVLQSLLDNNPNPQLESLFINNIFDPHLFIEFFKKCQSLIDLRISGKEYKGRKTIERRFGISHERREH